MKNIWKQVLLISAVSGSALLSAGCAEDKMPALDGYPATTPLISIAGEEGNPSTVNLKGKYDAEGKITLNGTPSRTYVITLPTPNAEDVVLNFEPIHTDIPAEKVAISATKMVIPAGSVTGAEAGVTVSLIDDDFSFARPNYDAAVYELGLRVTSASGVNIELQGAEGKVVIEKEAYTAGYYLSGELGAAIDFGRVYNEGKIINKDAMSYTFKVHLDKPAASPVKVTFKSTGLPEQFASTMVVSPAEVTIPAGEIVSSELTWTLADDFLLTNAEEEDYKILLTPVVETEDVTVKPIPAGSDLTISVSKVFHLLKVVGGVQDNWSVFDRTGWSATGSAGVSGSPENVLDDNPYSDIYTSAAQLWVAIDMKATHRMVGISVQYYGSSYATKKAIIESSMDGQTWTEIGTLSDLPKTTTHYIKIAAPQNAKYMRFTSVEKYGSYHDLSIIKVYGMKE